jgi:heterotetrameric sarcosine oxidase gamma subunit
VSITFLTPEAEGDRVVARSPMERLARAAGARLEQRGGWNVAVSYAEAAQERRRLTESVAFADRSSLGKLELQAEPAVLARVIAQASGGAQLELGRAQQAGDAWWCPVTPARALVLSDPGSAAAVHTAVQESVDGAALTIVDVTCGLAAISLAGPSARELLARFCAIDVRPAVTPVMGFRPGSVARTPGYVLRESEDGLLILVGWALGEYLFQVVSDAAEHLGGGPVGADSLAAHLEAGRA